MNNYKENIFKSIGNLLYAISKDRKPSLIARGEIRMLLSEIWFADTMYGRSDKATRAPKVISLTFDTLANQNVSADEAFENFENFYLSFPEIFSLQLKQKIMETAEAILDVIHIGRGPNKYMEKLRLLFHPKAERVLSRRTSVGEPA
jgi:hypothetical protein